MNDRQNKPSASGIARLAACPGSFRLESGLPDSSTEASESGTHIHNFLAGQLKPEWLTPEQMEIAESCQAIEADLLTQWKLRNHIPDEDAIHEVRDAERLWLRDECSGLADVTYIHEDKALVLDFKTGRVAADGGSENLQLRCLAVLVSVNYPAVMMVEVAVIQPLVTHTPEICRYEVEDLYSAELELQNILALANQPDALLHTGDHCKFCRAASICPEVRKEVETLSALTINASGLTVPDEDIAALRGKCGMAKKMIAAIEAEAFKRAQADPETWRKMGWEIKEGAGRRSVEDVKTVSERLNREGVDWPEITEACSITIGDVEALTRKATGAKGIALKDKVSGVLLGCVGIKTAKPTLKRIGKEDEE